MKNQDPKEFDKKKLKYYFNKIIQRIKKKPAGHFAFKKMKGLCGLCEWEDGIKIDPRRDIIPTIMHEVLHDLYPQNKEIWVSRMESKIMKVLNSADYVNLLLVFCNKLDVSN